MKKLTYEEALERVKRSHHIAMAMLCGGLKDVDTEKALKRLEEAVKKAKRYEELKKYENN